MSSKLDDLIAAVGAGCILSGVYLWIGLAATLILLGCMLVYVAAMVGRGDA